MSSAALHRFEAQGRPLADQPLLAWSMHHAVYEMQNALNGFIDNFPNRPLALLLRLVVFPLGRWEREPGDRLCQRVAQLMLTPSEARDRLSHGVYLDKNSQHPISLMELALPKVIAAEPLERKLQKAVKAGTVPGIAWEEHIEAAVRLEVLSEEEARALQEVRELVQEIIAVDDFASEELRLGELAEPEPEQQTVHSNAA
jgi:acyl-CoA dehydrogenase